ncbi:MAG: hypothetical protein K6B13_14250 [Prevotella sp.]|nr:hypothetical protein [Prevotella sp.]
MSDKNQWHKYFHLDDTQQFVSDDNIGTSWQPYVIDLQKLPIGISDVNMDGTDEDDWHTLQGFKVGRKPAQHGVYINGGKKVLIK